MRWTASILAVALLAGIAGALPNQSSVDELKARLQNAKPDERVTLSLEIAERQVASADQLYRDGKPEEAEAAIKDVVTYAEQAGKNVSGRHMKNTEIAMRKMSHRLGDIKRTVAFENQATVQSAIDSLEKIRTSLLNRMFGKDQK